MVVASNVHKKQVDSSSNKGIEEWGDFEISSYTKPPFTLSSLCTLNGKRIAINLRQMLRSIKAAYIPSVSAHVLQDKSFSDLLRPFQKLRSPFLVFCLILLYNPLPTATKFDHSYRQSGIFLFLLVTKKAILTNFDYINKFGLWRLTNESLQIGQKCFSFLFLVNCSQ